METTTASSVDGNLTPTVAGATFRKNRWPSHLTVARLQTVAWLVRQDRIAGPLYLS